jgi:hypothetical protein
MKAYPQESPKVFIDYVSKLMDEYVNEDYSLIFGRMINDEYSSDDTLGALLFNDGATPSLIVKLMKVREYFWDFNYSQLLKTN